MTEEQLNRHKQMSHHKPDAEKLLEVQSRIEVSLIAFGGHIANLTTLVVTLTKGIEGLDNRVTRLEDWRDRVDKLLTQAGLQ